MAKHDTAVEKAVENGRLEGTMKLRLKDTQLVRAQNRVKELEKQIDDGIDIIRVEMPLKKSMADDRQIRTRILKF